MKNHDNKIVFSKAIRKTRLADNSWSKPEEVVIVTIDEHCELSLNERGVADFIANLQKEFTKVN